MLFVFVAKNELREKENDWHILESYIFVYII